MQIPMVGDGMYVVDQPLVDELGAVPGSRRSERDSESQGLVSGEPEESQEERKTLLYELALTSSRQSPERYPSALATDKPKTEILYGE